jgi:hypothetical protein
LRAATLLRAGRLSATLTTARLRAGGLSAALSAALLGAARLSATLARAACSAGSAALAGTLGSAGRAFDVAHLASQAAARKIFVLAARGLVALAILIRIVWHEMSP